MAGEQVPVTQEGTAPEQQGLAIFATPINVPPAELDAIATWLSQEISTAKGDRAELEANIVRFSALYDAKAETRTFPWEGACGLTVPTIATAVDTLMANFMGTIFGGKDVWIGSARSAKWTEIVDPVTTWINWVGKSVIKLYKVAQPWFLYFIKYGTGITKLTWEQVQRQVVFSGADGNKTVETVTKHNGPVLTVVPLEDFFVSSDGITTQDLQYCSWVGHRFRKTWKQLKELEGTGTYQDVDKIRANKRSAGSDKEEQTQAITGVSVSDYKDYELFEIWCSYTMGAEEGQEGVLKDPPAELIITIEPESKTIVRAVYNFYRHQERPFHRIRLMPREDSIYGIGLAEMLESVQDEVTAQHRQRIDNGTIANTKGFIKTSGADVPEDGIYPGVIITVEEKDDFKEFSLGTSLSSTLQEELHTNSIGEKRSGVSDYSVGRESAAIGSRATATSTMALLREGNKRFLMTIQEIRETLSDIAHQSIMLYQQFAPDGKVIYELFSEKDNSYIQQFLQLPSDLTRNGLIIDIPSLTENQNKEQKQQALVMLLGAIQKIYESLFQAFSVAVNPQAPQPVKELAAQGAKTASMFMERLMESFDFKDADSFVPDVETLLGQIMQMNSMMEMGGQNAVNTQGTGGPESPGGLQNQPAMVPPVGPAPGNGEVVNGPNVGGEVPQ
jgi:hypothetical protein